MPSGIRQTQCSASKMLQIPCQEGKTALDLAKQRGFKACQEPFGPDERLFFCVVYVLSM